MGKALTRLLLMKFELNFGLPAEGNWGPARDQDSDRRTQERFDATHALSMARKTEEQGRFIADAEAGTITSGIESRGSP
jgi:hypothetical protein